MLGFIVTGVGLPLLGVIAVGLGGGNLQTLAGRVHPVFATVFTFIVYLSIGPFMAIPRTGTVTYEMGVLPFLSETMKDSSLPLFVTTIVYFALTFWLALNPSKLVDRIGKVLTPALLVIIGVMFFTSLAQPIGEVGPPTGDYQHAAFFKGFVEGYLTLDALAAMVFGIVVTAAVREKGITDPRKLTWSTIKAAVIAAIGLGLVYLALGYMGATSHSLGQSANGGQILTGAVLHLFGPLGTLLLGGGGHARLPDDLCRSGYRLQPLFLRAYSGRFLQDDGRDFERVQRGSCQRRAYATDCHFRSGADGDLPAGDRADARVLFPSMVQRILRSLSRRYHRYGGHQPAGWTRDGGHQDRSARSDPGPFAAAQGRHRLAASGNCWRVARLPLGQLAP